MAEGYPDDYKVKPHPYSTESFKRYGNKKYIFRKELVGYVIIKGGLDWLSSYRNDYLVTCLDARLIKHRSDLEIRLLSLRLIEDW